LAGKHRVSTAYQIIPIRFLQILTPSVERKKSVRDFIFLILAVFLFVIWIVSWLAFHVAGGLIHILLVIAIISLIVHFFRRSTA
jgi:hypothetical protein